LEVDPIRLETVRELSVDQIQKLTIFHGNKQPEVGEFFDVKGSADDNEMVWVGDCSKVKLIDTQFAHRFQANGIDLQGDRNFLFKGQFQWHKTRFPIKGFELCPDYQ
jgi:formylmethanofuran dehydrogenase subunit C